MNSILIAAFPQRRSAEQAVEVLRSGASTSGAEVRLHQGELDLMLSRDLTGSRERSGDLREAGWYFAVFFLPFTAVGLAIDLFGPLSGSSLLATMTLGSIGVLAAVLRALFAARRPLDEALAHAKDMLDRGCVLLTIPVDSASSESAAAKISAEGGRLLQPAPQSTPSPGRQMA